MFEFKACDVLRIRELTLVNDRFQRECNAEIRYSNQTLYSIINFCVPIPALVTVFTK